MPFFWSCQTTNFKFCFANCTHLLPKFPFGKEWYSTVLHKWLFSPSEFPFVVGWTLSWLDIFAKISTLFLICILLPIRVIKSFDCECGISTHVLPGFPFGEDCCLRRPLLGSAIAIVSFKSLPKFPFGEDCLCMLLERPVLLCLLLHCVTFSSLVLHLLPSSISLLLNSFVSAFHFWPWYC